MGLKFTTPKSVKNTLTGRLDNQSDIKLAPQNKTFTENGTYNLTIPEGFDGIDESVIKVQVPSEVNNQTKSMTITANGNYSITPDASHSGLDAANVNVSVQPKLQQKYSHKLNEVITPDAGQDGLSKVTVDVPVEQKSVTYSANGTYTVEPSTGKEAITKLTVKVETEGAPELEEKTITENGVYEPSAGKDGFSKVTVDVAGSGELEELTVTENGTYTPSEGKDGFSKVDVDVPAGEKIFVQSYLIDTEMNGEQVVIPTPVVGYDKSYIDKFIVRTHVDYPGLHQTYISANGVYYPTPESGWDGFNKVIVDVDDSQYDTYPIDETITTVGYKHWTPDPEEGSAFSDVKIMVDIAKINITPMKPNGEVAGPTVEVPMDRLMGGTYTTEDGRIFRIEW